MTHRNRGLLDLAREAPCLLLPGQHDCLGLSGGLSEPCHSDMIRHGRGEKHKSHDCFAVPGCHNAHLAFTRQNLGKEGYHAAWTEAMERYILWQWVTGKVRLADINQRPKESTMEAPMCKICETRHYVREPHQFEKVKVKKPSASEIERNVKTSSAIENTSADEAKGRKAGNARRDSSADCSSSRITARAGGTPVKNSSLGEKDKSKRIRQEGALNDAGGSADAVIAAGAKFAPMGESPERTPGANRAQNGVTAARGCKNTSREGRCVLKAAATQTDRDHLEAQPASPLRRNGSNGTAAKPKTAPKKRRVK